jgi:alpha-ketoglutarate-dependent taurine dioxygenase
MATKTALTVRPITPLVGAVVEGVDLRQPLDADTFGGLHRALLDHGAIFFHDQPLTREQLIAFVSNFGTPVQEPFAAAADTPVISESDTVVAKGATDVWHSDTTFVAEPPLATALRAVELPPVGGDTCWGNMYAAYDRLSEPIREMLDSLTAVHSMVPVAARMRGRADARSDSFGERHGLENIHPVVRVHPETGKKALFVNQAATTRIVELTPAESDHLLALLFEHVKSPDFTMRWRWSTDDVALWDNRSVQHYAVADYDRGRIMQRVVVKGDRPVGPERPVGP